jgi:hypothetical protein
MAGFLTSPDNLAFTGALVLMLLVGAVELLGLGGSAVELHLDADADLLGWLGVGRMPLLALCVLFLAAFGSLGLAGQQWADAALGHTLSGWVAAPAALVASLPATGLLARGLGPLMPRDETSAVELDELIGRAATVTVGTAAPGSNARARAEDRHGQAHFVMVEPNAATERFAAGDPVLLVRREGHLFYAIGRGDARLPRL